jgi:hypothetical protein
MIQLVKEERNGNNFNFTFKDTIYDFSVNVSVYKRLSLFTAQFYLTDLQGQTDASNLLHQIKSYFGNEYLNLPFASDLEKAVFNEQNEFERNYNQFLKEIVNSLELNLLTKNADILFIRNNDMDEVLMECGFDKWKDIASFRNVLAISTHDISFYKNLSEDGLLRLIEYVKTFLESFKILENKYPTLTPTFGVYDKVDFYYSGEQHYLILDHDENGYFVKLKNEKYYMDSPEKLTETIEYLLKIIFNSKRMDFLIKPNLYYFKKFTNFKDTIALECYNQLLKYFNSEEIEDNAAIAFKSNQKIKKIEIDGYVIFKIFDIYIIYNGHILGSSKDFSEINTIIQADMLEKVEEKIDSNFKKLNDLRANLL